MSQKIAVFRSGDGQAGTSQTSGMHREEFINAPGSWVGMVTTDPHSVSDWHHHGQYDTYVYVISGQIKMEFGKNGSESCVAKAGEALHIPVNTVHRESNPAEEMQVLFVVRVGQGAPVTNVDGPEK